MKKRVLVVDDDIDFTCLMKVALEVEGRFDVQAVVNSTYAVAAARNFKPDLVLLDCMMPHMDGGEVAAALQCDAALKHVPVVFLTALVHTRRDTTPDDGGAAKIYLPKTLPIPELVKIIKDMTGDAVSLGEVLLRFVRRPGSMG